MQIVETTNEGLKRAYTVTIPAAEITARIEGEVKRMAPQMKMPGFRPGKVPANLIRKMHGESLQGQALESAVQRRQLHSHPMRLSQGPGQLLERDVRLGPDDLQQERPVCGQLSNRPGRSALRLGRDMFSPGIWWSGLAVNLWGSEAQVLQMNS